jgi:hypothetical protein
VLISFIPANTKVQLRTLTRQFASKSEVGVSTRLAVYVYKKQAVSLFRRSAKVVRESQLYNRLLGSILALQGIRFSSIDLPLSVDTVWVIPVFSKRLAVPLVSREKEEGSKRSD